MQGQRVFSPSSATITPTRHYAVFAMGCFWRSEQCFYDYPGVTFTAVGYTDGHTSAPTYQQVCSGSTGHAEAVLLAYNPRLINYWKLLQVFWEAHNPTQGMRQGNDIGSQYRSAIFFYDVQQRHQAQESLPHYQKRLTQNGYGTITTTIQEASDFYYAEEYHQQYWRKNPQDYCPRNVLGVSFRMSEN